MGPLIHVSSVNTVNLFSLLYDLLNDILFSLAYFIVRIQHTIHVTYKIYVLQLFLINKAFGQQ